MNTTLWGPSKPNETGTVLLVTCLGETSDARIPNRKSSLIEMSSSRVAAHDRHPFQERGRVARDLMTKLAQKRE